MARKFGRGTRRSRRGLAKTNGYNAPMTLKKVFSRRSDPRIYERALLWPEKKKRAHEHSCTPVASPNATIFIADFIILRVMGVCTSVARLADTFYLACTFRCAVFAGAEIFVVVYWLFCTFRNETAPNHLVGNLY